MCLRRICYLIVALIFLLSGGCECTFDIEEDSDVPQWCKQGKPEYPIAARRAHAEGKVVLVATIDVDGRAKDIEVTEDNVGFGCAQAAIKALKASRFVPAKRDGEFTPVRISIPYLFKLVD